MSKKSIILTFIGHEEFVPHQVQSHHDYSRFYLKLYGLLTRTYIPLLDMCRRLEKDGIPFSFMMVLSPSLCAMLDDENIRSGYIQYLEKLLQLGESEISRHTGSEKKLAEIYFEKLQRVKNLFINEFGQNLLNEFKRLAAAGYIELLGTTATPLFLPHYIDLTEVINAQIEVGLISHRHYFGTLPSGFWLPHMGYTEGLEKNLKSFGLKYSILDAQGILCGNPTPDEGIFAPVRCSNSFVLYAGDRTEPSMLIGSSGYSGNSVYRAESQDVSFHENTANLAGFIQEGDCRIASGFSYNAQENGNSGVYDYVAAENQVRCDARDFLERQSQKLTQASIYQPEKTLSLVCAYDVEFFGKEWYEGIDWIEQLFRLAPEYAISFDIGSEHCQKNTCLQTVQPCMSASPRVGYGENLVYATNNWILRYTRKASERMIDLAGRFSDSTGLKARILNLAAKEVLLAQSSSWPQMIYEQNCIEYAEELVKDRLIAFTTIYDSLGANSISTEWLIRYEKQDTLFPWINYRVFSRKK